MCFSGLIHNRAAGLGVNVSEDWLVAEYCIRLVLSFEFGFSVFFNYLEESYKTKANSKVVSPPDAMNDVLLLDSYET